MFLGQNMVFMLGRCVWYRWGIQQRHRLSKQTLPVYRSLKAHPAEQNPGVRGSASMPTFPSPARRLSAANNIHNTIHRRSPSVPKLRNTRQSYQRPGKKQRQSSTQLHPVQIPNVEAEGIKELCILNHPRHRRGSQR